MKQQNVKTPLVFRVGIILLCMALLTVHLINDGFYARYSTKATGSGGAKVAKFYVDVKNDTGTFPAEQTLDLSVAADEKDVSWSFTVENESEVVSEEKIVVQFTDSIPEWITVAMTVNDEVCVPIIEGNTYTYVTEFPAGDSDTWVMKFIGNPDTAQYAKIDGEISVYVTQID